MPLRLSQEHEGLRHEKLERLRGEIAKGEADTAAGRFTSIKHDREPAAFLATGST